MVERYKRGKNSKKRKLLGNHQKCWVWGRNVVLETLRAEVWEIRDLWISAQLPDDERELACGLAERLDVETHVVEPDVLRAKCHSGEHQGYVARMTEFPYSSVEELDAIVNSSQAALIGICDSVQDPFNFGAIVRTAEVMGVDAIVTPATHQVGVTSLVARASAGAVNRIPIVRLPNLVQQLTKYKPQLQIVGASEKATTMLFDQDLTRPTGIIVGNEGSGISTGLLELCDCVVQIPQVGQLDSLNAAVSGSIFFYDARRQRIQSG